MSGFLNKFLDKKVVISIFALLFVVAFMSSCSKLLGSKDNGEALSMAANDTDTELLTNLEEAFSQENSKHSSIIDLNNSDVIDSLREGKVDLFVGTLKIPADLANSFKEVPVSKDGLNLVVNPKNPVNNLSGKQVKKIFSGAIKNWKDVGGDNQPIMVVNRCDACIEKTTFFNKVFNTDPPDTSSFVTVRSSQEVEETIIKFANAISYMNYTNTPKTLKALSYENIPATRSNIAKGYFPLDRRINLYFNYELLKGTKKYKTLKKFANFIHSPKGQSVIERLGLNPLTEAEIKLASLSAEPIYLGVAAPTQAIYIDLGKSIINGAKLAAEEFNKNGGINGRNVELIICDDKATTAGAIQCARKFIKNNVLGVVGHLNSQASIEASKIYVKNKIVQISPASTHPWYTERPDSRGFVFRTIGRDDQQAKLIAGKIRDLDLPHPVKVSIFNNGSVYGSTLSALVESEIRDYGVDEIVELRSIEPGQKQYFNEIQALKAQVLVFVGEYGDAASLVRSLSLNNKSDVVFVGAEGIYTKRFIEEAGLIADGSYVIGNAVLESLKLDNFKEAYLAKFKTEVHAFATNSYDATNILLKAIQKISAPRSADVAKEVKEINYNGVTGVIAFDEKGDLILPRWAVYEVQDGKFVKI